MNDICHSHKLFIYQPKKNKLIQWIHFYFIYKKISEKRGINFQR